MQTHLFHRDIHSSDVGIKGMQSSLNTETLACYHLYAAASWMPRSSAALVPRRHFILLSSLFIRSSPLVVLIFWLNRSIVSADLNAFSV
jgi:hypothetical protein